MRLIDHGHWRARVRPVLLMVLLGVAAAHMFAMLLRTKELFSADLLAAPVTAGAAAVAIGVIQCDRADPLTEFYDRAVRSSIATTLLPRLCVLMVGLVALLPASTGELIGDWGVLLVVRNSLLFTSWALALAEVTNRATAVALPAAWAGTLVVSSSAPPVVATIWRLPIAPADSTLSGIATFSGLLTLLLLAVTRRWRRRTRGGATATVQEDRGRQERPMRQRPART